jgi:hypothetical protein
VVIVLHAIRRAPTFFKRISIGAAAGVQKTGSDLTDRSVS